MNSQSSKYYHADSTESAFLVVHDVPLTFADELDLNFPQTRLHLDLYQAARMLLIETMVNVVHEMAKSLIYDVVHDKTRAMGLQLISCGSARVEQGSFIKEPDLSWVTSFGQVWPNVVVEVGVSETAQHLAVDAQGWLEEHLSRVNAVVTVDINRRESKITIERWERAQHQPHHFTRSHSGVTAAHVVETVNITRSMGVSTATGNFTIPFHALFDRTPQNAGEQDV